MSDSSKNKCPHCNKSFIKLNQHITKSHHKYEFDVSKDQEIIKMTHTFPDGKKEEVVFEGTIGGDETMDLLQYADNIYELRYYYSAKKIELSPVEQKNGKRVNIHLGVYKIITN